jgi:hypothetical protein
VGAAPGDVALHNVRMAVEPSETDEQDALPDPPQAEVSGERIGRLMARSRELLIWAGLITLALLAALATIHLVADAYALRGIQGGLSSIAGRLLLAAVLALAGLGVALLVAWLAGSTRRREMAAIAIGFIVLVALRVFLSSQLDGPVQGEPGTYAKAAASLLTSEWDFHGRPMAYPIAVAAVLRFSGDVQLATEVVNLVLAVLAGGAVLGLARGLYGPRAGVLALLGYAVWPAAALMTVVSIPQVAFDLTTVAAAWVAVAMPPGWRSGALTGAILGLGQYLRPTAPFMLPAYILALVWHGGRRRALGAALGGLVVAFLVALIPAMAFNLERTGSLSISTSDYGGHVLYQGTYEPSGGRFSQQAHQELVAIAGPDPLEWSRIGTEIAIGRIRDDPLGMAALGIRKQDTLWGTEHYGVQYGIGQSFRDRPQHRNATVPMLLSQGFYAFVLITATLGLWLRRRRPDALAPLVIVLIWTVSAMHALLEVRDRHHSYVIPLLLPFSALALKVVYEQLGQRLARARGA